MRCGIILLTFIICGCQTWQKYFPPEPAGDSGSVDGAKHVDEEAGEQQKTPALAESTPPPTSQKDKKRGQEKSVPASADAAHSKSDMELRLAKLWARVDEMENQQIQQKERMKLLEKGLMLGIIPEELKNPRAKPKKIQKDPLDEDEAAADAALKSEKTQAAVEPLPSASPVPPAADRSKDGAAYRQLLQKAQEKFNAAQYGQAIVHFNEIAEQFDDSITEGSQNYWIGLSWYYLKEYQLAEQSFKLLIEQYATNAWTPHARFYRAKIDQTRGMNQRALTQFQQLMEDFPNQDLGEMARMEVARMKDKL